MSYVVVGHCPKCGAPIYSPMFWNAITPPPVSYSCGCFANEERYKTSTGTNTSY